MCLNPLKGFLDPDTGQILQVRKSSAVAVLFDGSKWKTIYDENDLTPDCLTQFIDMPCRSCPECYQQSRREWIARAVAESKCHDKMIFLTLTYNDDKIPIAEYVDDDGVIWKHPTLRYSDFQSFMKRLRTYLYKPIRFMVCGEYGSHTFRPHYHAIIYGVGLDDFPAVELHSVNSHGDSLYTCSDLEFLWRNGYVLVSNANVATISYVAGYVAKKAVTADEKRSYSETGIVRPFIRSSNRPGLGMPFITANLDKFQSPYDYISVSTADEPFKLFLTQNWRAKYEKEKIYAPMVGNRLISEIEHDKMSVDKTEYFLNKQKRRQELFDNRFDNLDTDMSKDDYNSARNIDFRNSSKRKRGVY